MWKRRKRVWAPAPVNAEVAERLGRLLDQGLLSAEEFEAALYVHVEGEDAPVQYCCSFCGKSQEQVRRLIAGPGGVYICNECIELCQEITSEEISGAAPNPAAVIRTLAKRQEQVSAPFGACPLCGEALAGEPNRVVCTIERDDPDGGHTGKTLWQCHMTCYKALSRSAPPEEA